MKFLENTKLTGAALLLLLGLNSALLVVLIARKPPVPPAPMMPPPMPPPPGGEPGPKAFLIRELGLSTEQQTQYQALIDVHKTKLEALMNDIKSNRDSMISALGADKADSTHVKSWSNRIANDQQQLEELNYYHFRDVRALCTDDQKPKFDSVIHEALHMMGMPGPPPLHVPPR